MADEAQEGVSKPVVWVGADELPVHFVNQWLGVVGPGEVHLTLGTLTPPAIMGETVEDRKAQVEAIPFVAIKPVARIAMAPGGLRQLIGILQETLANYEKQQQHREQQP